jgi:hypothetical protein
MSLSTKILLFLCVQLLVLQDFGMAQLRNEVVNGDTILIFTQPMRDKFDESVSASVSSTDSSFLYHYRISSSPVSEQNIWFWMIITEADILHSTSPKGWRFIDRARNPRRISWGAQSDSVEISPSSSKSGFSVISKNLPAIQQYFMEGWEQIILESGNEPDSVENKSFFDVAKEGLTIFPRPNPGIINPQGFTDTLQTFRRRSCEELGWITNKGICNSLDVKLQNVERHLERNKPRQAGNVLNAFLNELNAQRGKHITEEGYVLLYYNAEYLQKRIKEVE